MIIVVEIPGNVSKFLDLGKPERHQCTFAVPKLLRMSSAIWSQFHQHANTQLLCVQIPKSAKRESSISVELS